MTVEPDQSQATVRGSIPVDSFANRLMLARAHAGHISIREAADLCGIGRGAWTNWEKGARPVDIIDIAAAVADKLGVDRDWLLFGGQLASVEPRSLRRSRVARGRAAIAH
jgi:transcriptional regulator with XRE-family HTH domain